MQQTGPTKPTDSILPTLARTLREGRFRPAAIAEFLRLVIAHGRQHSRDLKALRRSYFRCLGALALVLAGAVAALALQTSWGTGMLAAAVQSGTLLLWSGLGYLQLALVRSPDGVLYPRFGLANTLTLFRLVAMPLAVLLIALMPAHPDLGVLLCAVYGSAALSDLLDGMVSRGLNQTSDFGRIWDPVGDILFNPPVAIALYAIGEMPGWLMGLTVYRYWGTLLAGMLIYVIRGPFFIMPTALGKIAGFTLGWVAGFGVLRTALGGAWPSAEAMGWAYLGTAILMGICIVNLTYIGIRYVVRPPGAHGRL